MFHMKNAHEVSCAAAEKLTIEGCRFDSPEFYYPLASYGVYVYPRSTVVTGNPISGYLNGYGGDRLQRGSPRA
jgi:hypothetical protein